MQTVIGGVLTTYELINPKATIPVVILHGWGQSSLHWLETTKLLDSDFSYYLLDLPGFGGTKNLATSSDIPGYSQFVKDFTQKLKLKNFILMGHSFGGQIAGDLAIQNPQLLKQLVLIDASIVRTRRPKTVVKIALAKIVKPLISFFPTTTKTFLLRLYNSDYSASNDYQRSVLNKIVKYNLGPKLHLIKVPTDIVWGSEDKVIRYMGKYLVENIPQAQLHLIYGAGHSPNVTHPQKLSATLNQILNHHSP